MPKLKACSYFLFAKTIKGNPQKPAKQLGAFHLDVRDDEPVIIATNNSGDSFNIYDHRVREFTEAGVLLEGYTPTDDTLTAFFLNTWLVVPMSVSPSTLKQIESGKF